MVVVGVVAAVRMTEKHRITAVRGRRNVPFKFILE